MQTLTANSFQTFGDPVLVTMLNHATEYASSYRNGGGGWLSFLGGSGTGKTFLASQLTRHLDGSKKSWPKFMARMRSGEFSVYESVQVLCETKGLLMLDEIGVGNDAKTFGLDLLMQVLEGRRAKPLILTSNLTLEGLAGVDARLSSRLLRNGKVVACDTTDYALRKVAA
jgi:DNA replication protein DnaC